MQVNSNSQPILLQTAKAEISNGYLQNQEYRNGEQNAGNGRKSRINKEFVTV